MKTKILLCFMLLVCMQLQAQKTVTNKDHKGRIVEQYQLNRNGDYHGSYVSYFANGFSKEERTYSNGKLMKSKTYEYYDNKRYLMNDITWDKNGELLTSKMRQYDSTNGKVGDVIERAGLLPNGRWRGWPGHETYIEIYNGNDTIYEWRSRDKSYFIGKHIGDITIYGPERQREIDLHAEKARQDSINREEIEAERIRLAEEKREQEKQRILAKLDSIEQGKALYDSTMYACFDTNELYNSTLANANITEQKFYSFLCKYIQKKKNFDLQLKTMIANVLDIDLDLDDLDLILYKKYDTMQNKHIYGGGIANKKNELIFMPYTGANTRRVITHNKPHTDYRFYTDCNLPKIPIVDNKTLLMQSKQHQLIDIISYCAAKGISVK